MSWMQQLAQTIMHVRNTAAAGQGERVHALQELKTSNMHNIGALIIRIRFWGILYYTYKKDPPK